MRIEFVQKLIDKLRGKKKCEICEKPNYSRIIYSQDGEDAVLFSYIYQNKPSDYKGFYVDIGAHHPQRFSNTNIFHQMGWSGINIDGTPGSMEEFNIQRPNDINIEAVISIKEEDVTYYCFEEPALNSFDEKIANECISGGWPLKEKRILKTQKISDILDKNVPPEQKIDFINIDIEGVDYEVICSLNYKKYEPEYFIIEELEFMDKDFAKYSDISKIYQFLASKNYIVVGKTMRSVIYKKLN